MTKVVSRTLSDLFNNPSPPFVSQDQYVSSELTPGVTGLDIRDMMPGAGQQAVPPPQKLYDLGSYANPFSVLWRRPRNVLQG